MTATASFFQTGYGGLDAIEQRIQSNREKADKPWRFFMKPNTETRVIFLDDAPPVIEEHQLKVNGKWGNFFTCLKNTGAECPLCNAGDRPYTVGFYHILDRTEFKNKDGNIVKDRVRVLAAKFKSLKQFKKFSIKYGGLTGLEFEVSRSGEATSPSIGDTYLKEDKHDAGDLAKLLGKPLDQVVPQDPEARAEYWTKYLAPKDPKELAAVVSGKANAMQTEDEVDFD